MPNDRMSNFFRPHSIAIVGASTNPKKTSGRVLRNLIRAGFTGRLFPVNPTASEIEGLRCFSAVTELPETPDVVLSMVDAPIVPSVLEQCGRKGVKAAIIGASGFGEAGPAGEALQATAAEISSRYGIRVCGPNCNGLYNIQRRIPIGYNFVHGVDLKPGGVAIASQSGALLGSVAHRAHRMDLGLSYFVSTGNEMDLELCDYADFFLADDQTRVVALLIEGLRDGPRFLDLACRAHRLGKAIVVLKLGRSRKGAISAVAHTARMAGSAEVYDSAFRQFGVISTDTIEAFLGAAQLAATQPPPPRGKLMVISSTGGGASLIADKAEQYGIELAELTDEVKAKIPAHKSAIINNPFDVAGGSQRPGFFEAMCGAFAADPASDVILLFLHELMVRERFASVFSDAVKPAGKSALAVLNLVGEETEQIFRRNNIPCFDGSVDACLSALRSYINYGRFYADRDRRLCDRSLVSQMNAAVKELLDGSIRSGILPEPVSRRLLGEYGFKFPAHRLASSLVEAEAMAAEIGYPVILKGAVPNLAHRSAEGLVSRPVMAASELQRELGAIENRMRVFAKDGAADKVLLEKYLPHDCEIILGIKYDPTFGPAVLFGLGGTFAEVLKDFSIRLAPVTPSEAAEMVAEIKGYPLLKKYLSDLGLALELILESVLRASRLAIDLGGRVSAIDINPLALAPGHPDPIILDAKIHMGKDNEYSK
jgi:acyl-CoA synthetase (NDP forming)